MMATVLTWCGAVGAWLFVVVFLLDGWTRPGYSTLRHPVSALALGPRGWIQATSFVLFGAAITAGGAGLVVAEGSLLLAAAIAVFGLALIASGIFPMDPMRGYPPGAPEGTPSETSRRHVHHDRAGAIVFGVLPVAAVIAAFVLVDTGWRWYSGVTAAALTAGFVAFGQAWEDDHPLAGLVQKVTIIIGWSWLGALFVHARI
jgi:hypothetical protein